MNANFLLTAPMPTLAKWLATLRLEQYAQVFAEQQVDLDSVRLLSETDLRELGLPLGPRKLVLRAIEQLNGGAVPAGAPTAASPPVSSAQAGAPLMPAASGAQITPFASDQPDHTLRGAALLPLAPLGAPPPMAQRRQLTVLFCDLVGSTALSRALDPEDLRDLMRRYQAAARAVIERYEGHVEQYLGDGIMAYFGWPRGHGDDAQRALHAALALVDAVRHLEAPEQLAARIGVATGLVVVGLGAENEPQNAVGETPNLAARLQALAQPNAIVVAELTRTLAGEAFAYRDLGAQNLKGFDLAVHAYAVSDADGAASAAECSVAPALLVGRDEELGLLRRAWQLAADGHGQVVMVSGEPGIGKSALAEDLLGALRPEGKPCLTVRCSAFHTNSVMFPVVEHVRRIIGWVPGDPAQAQFARLEAWLDKDSMPLARFAPSLAALLELPLPPERYAPLKLSAQDLKRRINDDLVEWQIAAAERAPMVLLWEDLHWADPSSLDYAALLIEQLPTVPMLLVLTARPPFSAPWAGKSHLTPITLSRLERPQVLALVQHLGKGKALPGEVLEHIVAKTDGVPMFVEELTRTILGRGLVRDTGVAYELTGPLSRLAIPATLQESLMARLDRTPWLREVAQLGAVLGREFAYDALKSLGLVDAAALDEGLNQLVAHELLYQRGRIPHAKYVFKHALIQDAAYQSLLKRTRQHYHAEVARGMEQRSPDVAQQHPELLAHHWGAAGETIRASEYWLLAIRRAGDRAAFAEALAQVAAAMTQLESLPDSAERTRLRAKLQLQRALAWLATRGMGSTEAGSAFIEARVQFERLGEATPEIIHTLYGIYAYHLFRGEVGQGLAVARESLQRAQGIGDAGSLTLAHRMLGSVLFFSGAPREAAHHCEEALRMYDPQRERESPLWAVADVKTISLSILATASALLGYPDKALALHDEAARHAAELDSPHSSVLALSQYGATCLTLRDSERGIANEQRVIALADQYGFRTWRAHAKCRVGQALIELGRFDEGLAELEAGLAESGASGSSLGFHANAPALADALVHAGRWQVATERYEQAVQAIEASGEARFVAHVQQRYGEFLLARDGAAAAAAAEACFVKALEVARAQGARWWELRSAHSLARLWHHQGKRREARDLLEPLVAWFTEGFNTRDLKEALALLAEMR